MLALIAPVLGLVTSTSVTVIIDNAAKMIIPPTTKALAGYGVKAGVAVASFVIGRQVSRIVVKNASEVVQTIVTTEVPAIEN